MDSDTEAQKFKNLLKVIKLINSKFNLWFTIS